MSLEHVLIVADIEGCSGCWSYAGSAFLLNSLKGRPGLQRVRMTLPKAETG
jgi:hypothetical protein